MFFIIVNATLNIFVQSIIFLLDSLMNGKFKRTAFISNGNLYIINVYTVTFDQFSASLLNRSIHFFKKLTPNV